jgi:hypothetical protein
MNAVVETSTLRRRAVVDISAGKTGKNESTAK